MVYGKYCILFEISAQLTSVSLISWILKLLIEMRQSKFLRVRFLPSKLIFIYIKRAYATVEWR